MQISTLYKKSRLIYRDTRGVYKGGAVLAAARGEIIFSPARGAKSPENFSFLQVKIRRGGGPPGAKFFSAYAPLPGWKEFSHKNYLEVNKMEQEVSSIQISQKKFIEKTMF